MQGIFPAITCTANNDFVIIDPYFYTLMSYILASFDQSELRTFCTGQLVVIIQHRVDPVIALSFDSRGQATAISLLLFFLIGIVSGILLETIKNFIPSQAPGG
jgi:hypothetical protein